MDITISTRHGEIDQRHKSYVREKLEAVLEDRPIKIINAKVVFDVQKNRQMVELIVNVKHQDFEATAETYDMHESIDTAVDKISSQMARYVDKVQDHHKRRGATSVTPETEEVPEEEEV